MTACLRPMEKGGILERLVKLHDERVVEEKAGKIRWLRPEYQIPRFAPKGANASLGIVEAVAAAPEVTVANRPWPGTAVEQLTAIGAVLGAAPMGSPHAVGAFEVADTQLVARHLETLALMGEIVVEGEGMGRVMG